MRVPLPTTFARAMVPQFIYIGSMNTLEPMQLTGRNCVRWRGRTLLHFSGCDYFRLASHPAVLKAAAVGLKKFGLNVAASRLTTGHHPIYEQLEDQLAKFFGAPDALLVSGGYPTGTVVAQALAGGFSHVLMDERAHPALQDAAAHFGCPILKFKHRDPEDLQRTVARCGRGGEALQSADFRSGALMEGKHLPGQRSALQGRFIVLTDGMFSHDGSAAPLKAYLKVLPRDAQLLVDDAHGAGVLGATGKGTLEHAGVGRQRIIQCVTLSKAFGVYGGAVLGTRELREKILTRSRAFIGCTPLPPPLANATVQSVKILGQGGKLLARLHRNVEYVKAALRRAGFAIPELPGPIIAIHPRSEAETRALRRRLLAAGIYPPFLKYAGAEKGFFRFVISSGHTRAQLEALVAVLLLLEGGKPRTPNIQHSTSNKGHRHRALGVRC